MTEITQADRDAAEAYREKVLDAIWVGGPEDQVLLEAFARHRMEERAAIVAWLHKQAALALAHDMELFKRFDQAKLEFAVTVTENHATAIEAGEHLK